MPAFVKGQSGNPKGRPKGKGRTITVNKFQAAVSARALDQLEQGLGKAWDVIDEALDESNTQVAMWLIERLTGGARSMLPEVIDIKLDSIEAIMLAAQAVTELTLHRKLSVDDAQKSLTMLTQFCSFRGYEGLEVLKEQIDELKRASEAKTIDGAATRPSWGRLSESSPVSNTKPAE